MSEEQFLGRIEGDNSIASQSDFIQTSENNVKTSIGI